MDNAIAHADQPASNTTIPLMMSATNPIAAGKNIPRRYDITGAPFHIGAHIFVEKLVDPETLDYLAEETDLCPDDIEGELVGLEGVLVHYDYDCGCGQIFPDQPMIGVRIAAGKFEGEIIEFWPEELLEVMPD